ncbi:DUF5361 domain-containing protein [Streptococcus porcinus]|uniref:DUF5361 domain-containing protein n=1 Tax=Streptococcus porcinus TaxID=1340 RepID=A0A7V9WT23_STRPO|nr:DUF5361 domain-containing protein [Streptococcus porcinus]MBA2796557.1 DUF5361 domain-containing protein [Streptococcus porcinus]
MIKADEDALICDLAETYHIYDYRQLPADLVAVFSAGLRENSRIRMSMSEEKLTVEQTLIAGILDRLSILLWSKTKDGQKGINQPKSVIESVNAKPQEEITSFETGEDFMKVRQKYITKGGN